MHGVDARTITQRIFFVVAAALASPLRESFAIEHTLCPSMGIVEKWWVKKRALLPVALEVDGGHPDGLGHPQELGRGRVGDGEVALVGEAQELLVEAARPGQVGDAVADVVHDAHAP